MWCVGVVSVRFGWTDPCYYIIWIDLDQMDDDCIIVAFSKKRGGEG